MSLLAVQGGATGTGTVTLLAPVTNTNRTLTLPDETGTVVTTGSTSVVTPTMLTQPFTSGTAVASTSGTSIDFTSIPSWVKRITVMFSGVSTTGSSALALRIGPVAGVETSGYLGAAGKLSSISTTAAAFTSSFGLVNDTGNSTVYHGVATLVLLNSATNLWAYSFTGAWSDQAYVLAAGGSKPLAGTLSILRLTTVGGSDTFDAGSLNILYEG